MNTNDRVWHREYEEMPQKQKNAISAAFDEARHALDKSGQFDGNLPTDDRAEALVAAITRYARGC